MKLGVVIGFDFVVPILVAILFFFLCEGTIETIVVELSGERKPFGICVLQWYNNRNIVVNRRKYRVQSETCIRNGNEFETLTHK